MDMNIPLTELNQGVLPYIKYILREPYHALTVAPLFIWGNVLKIVSHSGAHRWVWLRVWLRSAVG